MNDKSEKPVYGRVSSVFFDEDKKDVFVNVVTGPNREPRKMMFSSPRSGIWYVPQEGDIVEVQTIGGLKTARNPINPPNGYGLPTDLSEGDVCFRLNENTELHFSVKGDGTVDVQLTADGEVTVTAPSVKIGDENGTFKSVAREGDPISGTDSQGGAVSGQIDSGSSSVQSS